MSSRKLMRSRWAAIGAAVAVTLGGGGLIGVSAASGDASSFTSVTPVRILNTRTGEKLSTETTALQVTGAIDTFTSAGTVSATVVPAGANAVAVNVTVTGAETKGYVTAFPCAAKTDTPPNASTLNFNPGVDLANSTVVEIGATGKVCFYVKGTAHLLADVQGYYTTADAAIDAYTKTETDTLLANYATGGYFVTYDPINGGIPSSEAECTTAYFSSSMAIKFNDAHESCLYWLQLQPPSGDNRAYTTAGAVLDANEYQWAISRIDICWTTNVANASTETAISKKIELYVRGFRSDGTSTSQRVLLKRMRTNSVLVPTATYSIGFNPSGGLIPEDVDCGYLVPDGFPTTLESLLFDLNSGTPYKKYGPQLGGQTFTLEWSFEDNPADANPADITIYSVSAEWDYVKVKTVSDQQS